MKRRWHTWALALVVLVILLTASGKVLGQEPQLTLRLRRDWGYGGFGEIQGNCSLLVNGPQDLERVIFWLDNELMGEVTQAPWRWKFHTSQYVPGVHTLYAIGHTQSGLELRSNEIRVRFLSPAEAGRAVVRVILVLLGGIAAVVALAATMTFLLSRGTKRQPESTERRSYGLLGGTVCPKCNRPFPLHWWAPNVGWFTKFDRCPHCGQWSWVKRASTQDLAAAETAQRQRVTPSHPDALTEEERLRRELDESRFLDG